VQGGQLVAHRTRRQRRGLARVRERVDGRAHQAAVGMLLCSQAHVLVHVRVARAQDERLERRVAGGGRERLADEPREAVREELPQRRVVRAFAPPVDGEGERHVRTGRARLRDVGGQRRQPVAARRARERAQQDGLRLHAPSIARCVRRCVSAGPGAA
jgi:hypothetical protein